MKSWERFSLFCNAERNARYRASLPVVEVDRREQWVSKMVTRLYKRAQLARAMRAFAYHDDPSFAIEQVECIHKKMIAESLPISGEDYYQ